MYHSTATLLPDGMTLFHLPDRRTVLNTYLGSVLISGSNPNADYNVDVPYPTEYRIEKFYPSYFNTRRPQPKGLLSQLSYGGDFFDVYLDSDDLFGDVNKLEKTKVTLVRTGFSTHSMNMGQRFLELNHTHTGYANNTATLHVHQLPPSSSIFPPGPALLFVVVDDVPSVAVQVMVGSGKIGKQPVAQIPLLPESSVEQADVNSESQNNSNEAAKAVNFHHGMWLLLVTALVCTWT